MDLFEKILTILIGKRLHDSELSSEKFSVLWGIPVFASDAISSVSYAGEEILLVLVPALGALAFNHFVPIVCCIIALLSILVICYRQTIDAYPHGGGAYIVASENLGEKVGLIAGSSLIMDYVLTVAVSSCASAAAITSAFPSLYPYKAFLAFSVIILLTWGNLRGIRESAVLFGIPTYMFIITMLSLIITGIVKYSLGIYTPAEVAIVNQSANDTLIFVIIKSFASGCTALTGVEAVSNGVPNFKEPAQKHAQKVLLAMAGFVCMIFLGVSFLTAKYQITPNETVTVVSQLASAVFGTGSVMYYVVQIMTVVILALAANTAFADVPLLMALIAHDGYLPKKLISRGTRLNYSNGILFLFFTASILVFIFKGDQHHLLPLYASGVFISFTLSQAGMFIHWLKNKGKNWQLKATINGIGTVISGIVLIIIIIMKFLNGAWIALLCIAILIFLMLKIKDHYNSVAKQLSLDIESAKACVDRVKPTIVMIPVQSISRSFIKTLDHALACGFTDIELYNVSDTEENALKLKDELDKLNIPQTHFVYETTGFRNTNQVLLHHVKEKASQLEDHQTLTVMMGAIISKSSFGKYLDNTTTNRISRKMSSYRNVSVITVPFIV